MVIIMQILFCDTLLTVKLVYYVKVALNILRYFLDYFNQFLDWFNKFYLEESL